MTLFRKIAAPLSVAIVGLCIWNMFPDFQRQIGWSLIAACACYVVVITAQLLIRRAVAGELADLKLQISDTSDKLDLLDRKITVLLKDAVARRRQRQS